MNTNTTQSRPEQIIWKVIMILCVFGVMLSTYLFYNFVVQPEFQPCSISETVNCDAITKGPVSLFLGIPVALIGLAGYLVIFTAAFYKNKKVAFAMSLFGALFCLRLTIIEVFSLKVICPVCLLCQIDMIILSVLTLILIFKYKNK